MLQSASGQDVRQGLLDTARTRMDRPGQLRRLTQRVDPGEFTVVVLHKDLEAALSRIATMVNRLAVSVLVSASLIGFVPLIVAYRPGLSEYWWGWLFWLGLAFIAGAGLWLAFDIRRGQRH